MSLVRLSVKNFRALRDARWEIPEGLSVVVGPNGSGKTTLLSVLPLLGEAFRIGPQKAFQEIGGAAHIRNRDVDDGEPVRFEIALDGLEWSFEPQFERGMVAHEGAEELHAAGQEVIRRPKGDASSMFRGVLIATHAKLAIRAALDREAEDTDLIRMRRLLDSCATYESVQYNVPNLRRVGSPANSHDALHPNGFNAFSVLRNWLGTREHKPRFAFVQESLQQIFGEEFVELDFETAGQTVALRTYHPRFKDQPLLYADVSTGLQYAMLQLMGVASAPIGGVVAIDEPETALHPEAIRRMLQCMEDYATKNQLRVAFATHSPVVLDHFKSEPQRVFVMQRGESTLPVRLDELHAPEWLRQFSLGDLYTANDFGAPKAAE